jgi:hypothetical protein
VSEPVLAPVRTCFRALACTFVPEAKDLDERAWAEAEAIVEKFFASRPETVRRQVVLLIRVLDLLPVFRWGRRFRSLDPERRLRFLAALQDAPLLLVRRGTWGLRTIAFMGYYARADASAAIGYRADRCGWEAR